MRAVFVFLTKMKEVNSECFFLFVVWLSGDGFCFDH